jgi:hypothetical protein
MINHLDYAYLEPWLHKDMVYESQQVFADIRGKRRYGNYIRGKLDTIRDAGARVYAEIAYADALGAGPCVIIAQGSELNWDHVVLVETENGKIKRLDMTIIPAPSECRRSGDRPV